MQVISEVNGFMNESVAAITCFELCKILSLQFLYSKARQTKNVLAAQFNVEMIK